MPIHRVDLADQSSLLGIYATNASQSILPRYRMPEGRTEPRAAYVRNSTPSLNAIMEESRSSVAAVPYPVACAFTTVLALIGGYFSMILS